MLDDEGISGDTDRSTSAAAIWWDDESPGEVAPEKLFTISTKTLNYCWILYCYTVKNTNKKAFKKLMRLNQKQIKVYKNILQTSNWNSKDENLHKNFKVIFVVRWICCVYTKLVTKIKQLLYWILYEL